MDRDTYLSLAEAYRQVHQEGIAPMVGLEVLGDLAFPEPFARYTGTRGGPNAYWNAPHWKNQRTPEQRALDATYQRNAMGVVKGGNAGYIFKSPRREGESIEDYAKRKAEAEALADRLNKESGLGKYRTNAQGNTRDESPGDPERSTPQAQSQWADYEAGNVTDPSADRDSGQPLGVSPDDAEGIEDIRSRPPSGAPGTPKDEQGDDAVTKNPTDFQKWAMAHPHLAQRVRPGQAGYEEIKDMPEVRNAKQPVAGGIERRTPGPLNNKPLPTSSSEAGTPSVDQQRQRAEAQKKLQQAGDKYRQNLGKVNSGSQNMGSAPSTPGLRAASRLKDYSQKMNNNNQGSMPFRGLPEEFEKLTEGWEYVDEILLEAGLWRWLGKAAPKGWQWVMKNGRRVLQRMKGGVDDAARQADDAVRGATRQQPTRPSTILDKWGRPIQRPVTSPAQRPNSGLVRPRPQNLRPGTRPGTRGTTPRSGVKGAASQADDVAAQTTRKPVDWKGLRDLAIGTTVVGGGGYLAYKNRDKIGQAVDSFLNDPPSGSSDSPGGSGDTPGGSGDTPGGTTPGGSGDTPGTTPGGSGSTPNQPGRPGGSIRNRPPSDRLAATLRDTQNAITAQRKAKEGSNYSGPATIKNPKKYQSNIGTDFSDLKTEEFFNQLMETPKSEKEHSVTAKVIRRNARDGEEDLLGGTARRQFRSAALRGMKKPKPIKKPRQETRMPAKQLKDMQEGLPEPKVNYLKDMDPYDTRRQIRQLAPGSPLPPADTRPGLPDMRLKKAAKPIKKPNKVKKA
jgi:hypothetical protein